MKSAWWIVTLNKPVERDSEGTAGSGKCATAGGESDDG